jgi:DNA-binding CsgD family transcriptional regulator
MSHNRQLALIRKLCGLGLPAQTLAPSLLPALRVLIPAHSAAVFWVDPRYEMTSLYAERLLPPEAMARYYENHYTDTVNGFRTAFAARIAAPDPVSTHKVTRAEQTSSYFRDVLVQLDAYQILYGVLRDGTLPVGQISFYRGARDREFSRRDQDVLGGLLRYLAIGLRPQPAHARALAQAEVVEEWLGLVEMDGTIASAPADWSRLVRLLAMGDVAPRTAREEQRTVTDYLHRIVARLDGPEGSGAQHLDLQQDSPWGHFRLRAYRLPDVTGRPPALVGLLIGRKEPLALALARGTGASELSPQQREVAMLLAEGRSNQEIARALDLTLNTANYHVKQVFARLHVHSRDEVADVLLRLAHDAVIARGTEDLPRR